MKSFVIILSLIPIIISIVLFGYLIMNKMINLKTIAQVGIMIFLGVAFIIFIKYYFIWTSDVNLSDTISSSLGIIVFLLLLIVLTATKDGHSSVRHIMPTIKSFNFPTIALLLYVGFINLIIFVANVVKYKM